MSDRKEYKHNWYLKNREKVLQDHKKYREEHKEYFRSYARNNYRKKCGLPPLKNKI